MFETIVTIGDSITEGARASTPSRSWVQLLAQLVWLHQGWEGAVCNLGVGGSVLHHGAPTYEISAKPCGLDAYAGYVPGNRPELLVIAHGFNDCRGGEPVEVFGPVLQSLLRRAVGVEGRTVIVCSLYYSDNYEGFAPWDKSTRNLFLAYNEVIARAACVAGCIFADVWAAMGERARLLAPIDHVHPNDLGHHLIANRIFEALAQNVDLGVRSG